LEGVDASRRIVCSVDWIMPTHSLMPREQIPTSERGTTIA
jgi:hypothetical protein